MAGAIAFWGGWQTNGWRLNNQIAVIKTQQAEALATATREARATESRRLLTVQEAQNAAIKRAQTARADADSARTELDRLRQSVANTAGGVPGESTTACTQRAAATADLLTQCGGVYQELAATADRLNADRVMLLEAWPK